MKLFNDIKRKILGPAVILLVVPLLHGCGRIAQATPSSASDMLMGTFVRVILYPSAGLAVPPDGAINSAIELAKALEDRLSLYNPKSALNDLNRTRVSTGDPDLFTVIRRATEISRSTGGEFDVTVAPILKRNGFYSEVPRQILDLIPDNDTGVSWTNIKLDETNGSVSIADGTCLDLSGIAKGYIVDRMAGKMKEQGAEHFLINAGGDIYCTEKKDGSAWKIGLRDPRTGKVLITLGIKNAAVATSGDYENKVTDRGSGEVVSHIIDPSTDGPVKLKPSSVTVIAVDCMTADALATGMMAMGAEKAVDLADSIEGVEVITVDEPGSDVVVRYSASARAYVLGGQE
ncbi:MAG: FAD:protein FMN transferase [Candidatus Omnitrophica bacterium]|nr:FAD:protein FMN transferase [Candidatus Omnitrophota bacterium]MDD5488645.1 FAD:protein FMN transferase [Candidatus Omnitrophota bacterium]